MPFLVDDKTVFPEEAYFFNQKNKNLSSISIIDEIYVLCRFENLPAYLLILQKLKKKKNQFPSKHQGEGAECLVSGSGAWGRLGCLHSAEIPDSRLWPLGKC